MMVTLRAMPSHVSTSDLRGSVNKDVFCQRQAAMLSSRADSSEHRHNPLTGPAPGQGSALVGEHLQNKILLYFATFFESSA